MDKTIAKMSASSTLHQFLRRLNNFIDEAEGAVEELEEDIPEQEDEELEAALKATTLIIDQLTTTMVRFRDDIAEHRDIYFKD